MKGQKVCIRTVGCRTNKADSALIKGMLQEKGYFFTEKEEEADFIIINSCIVTAKAERETRRFIYRARRLSPSARIILTGCMAQVYPEKGITAGADAVIGLNEKDRIDEFIGKAGIFRSEPSMLRTGRLAFDVTRAFLKIQEGCEHFCTYCIVPYARGKSRSLDEREVVRSIVALEGAGYREVVLCGTNLGMYGNGETSLAVAIEKILFHTSRLRIRLSSIEPFYVSKELLEVISRNERVAKHLHIPVQSASNKVLKDMGRTYTFDEFRKLVDYIKKKDEFLCLGTDVIVGFPTEGVAEFRDTVDALERLSVDYFHVFPYSPRKGTKAYNYKSAISYKERKERARILIELGKEKMKAFIKRNVGRVEEVLIEKSSQNFSEGLSGNYIKVNLKAFLKENEFYRVRITGVNDGSAEGKID